MITIMLVVLRHLLLENPWPLVLALVVVGAVLGVLSTQRLSRRLAAASLVAFLLAPSILLLAHSVTTAREHIIAGTRELVASTVHRADLAAVDLLFSPEAVLVGPDGEVWLTYPEIRTQLERASERFAIREQSVRSLTAELEDGVGQVTVSLRSTLGGQAAGVPMPSMWELTWERADDAWRVTQVRCLQFMNAEPGPNFWKP